MVKKVTSILLVLVMIFSYFTMTAEAATSGNRYKTTMYVNTKANWLKPGSESVTLSRTTGTYKNGVKFTGSWYVSVYRYGTGTTKTYTFSSSSIKIPLARNASYKITISPTPSFNAAVQLNGGPNNVKTWSSWYVSKTVKATAR